MQEDRPNAVTLVLGGVRSGKSRYAQQLGERADRVIFVATARAGDEEMRQKIARHRASRPSSWLTIEEPLDLVAVISLHGSSCDWMILDCLTVWAANLLDVSGGNTSNDTRSIDRRIAELCLALERPPCALVLVSNEVGSGVVPPYPLGRRFRDLLGEMNQAVAGIADNVVLMVAGLPLALKGKVPELRKSPRTGAAG